MPHMFSNSSVTRHTPHLQLDIDPMGLWLPGMMPNHQYMTTLCAEAYVPRIHAKDRHRTHTIMAGDFIWSPISGHFFLLTGFRLANTVRCTA